MENMLAIKDIRGLGPCIIRLARATNDLDLLRAP